jgi:hypothetical protein
MTGSGGFRVELDRAYWQEFKRQVRVASNNLENIDHAALMRGEMREALTPLADAWRQNLPGSLKATVKVLPQSLTVRAGFPDVHGDHPFLPWIEFGGTVTWYRSPAGGPFKHLALPFGYRMRKVMSIKLPREPQGRHRYPAIFYALPETKTKVADAVQHMLNTVFHAP